VLLQTLKSALHKDTLCDDDEGPAHG
jgi:hypothetical protein